MVGKKIFYGWFIVLGAFLALMGSSFATWSVSGLMPAMIKELGWSRAEISAGLALNALVMAVMYPVLGALLDRIGVRLIVFAGGLIAFVSLLAVGYLVRTPLQFILLYGLIMGIGTSCAYIMPNVTTVRRWFIKRAGTAMGIVYVGSSVGMFLGPPLSVAMLPALGWRGSYVVFGVLAFVAISTGAFLLRPNPESMGTYPDGQAPDPELMKKAEFAAHQQTWSVRELFKVPAFYLLIVMNAAVLLGYTGLQLSFITWANLDMKLPLAVAAGVYSGAFIVAGIIGRLVVGGGADSIVLKWGRKPAILFSIGLFAIGLFYGSMMQDLTGLTIMAVLTGFGSMAAVSLTQVYAGDLFGAVSLPTVNGTRGLIALMLASTGPILFGRIHDATGSYNMALILAGILAVVSFVSVVAIRPPAKKDVVKAVAGE